MKIKYLYLVGLLAFAVSANAQYTWPVFPAKTGDDLLNAVVGEYKTTEVLEYGPARDYLYGTVYKQNDSVPCIYTDHKIYLPSGVDPSNHIFQNGVDNGINCEHSYPRSKGADQQNGNPYSDMHHLFPSRVSTNTDRGSFPFGEITDSQTERWYWKTIETGGIPSLNKDAYSEYRQGTFEPREASKGNIARAIFYFYTMYKDEANNSDPNFFPIQKDALCTWHYQDPVDSLEWVRTWRIAQRQDGLPNPFILDCTLASRSFCDGAAGDCPDFPISDTESLGEAIDLVSVYPNPTTDVMHVKSPTKIEAYHIFDHAGTPLRFEVLAERQNELNIDIALLEVGIYFLVLESNGQVISKKIIKE